MRLVDYLSTKRIFLSLRPGSKDDILEQIARLVVDHGQIDPSKADELLEKLIERESIKSTGIGSGVAVPHAIIDNIGQTFVSLAVCPEGTDFEAIDDQPVHIIVTLVGPLKDRPLHLKLLACIARLMIKPEIPKNILQAESAEEIYRFLIDKEISP